MLRSALVVLILLSLTASVSGQAISRPLALVDDVTWRPFRAHCQSLLTSLEKLSAPVPTDTIKAVKTLLESEPGTQRQAIADIQKLLDPYCLAGVHINPESRVKAARGSRLAELMCNQGTLMLIKVHNEGDVKHALAVSSEQAIVPGKKDPDRWVETALVSGTLPKRLTGRRLEYRLLRLTARQSGKREATLAFDVGQGSQDLGFRAEVPILFTVAKPR